MYWKNLKLLGIGAAIGGAAVLAGASPAWAAGSGVTIGGSSNVNVDGGPPAAPLCLKALSTSITLTNKGIFNNAVVDTTAKWSTTTDYYFSPAGTFNDPVCRTQPTAVSGSLTVTNTATGATLCTAATTTYQRVSNDYRIQSPTGSPCGTLVYTGNQSACLPLPADPCGPDGEREFEGVYEQV